MELGEMMSFSRGGMATVAAVLENARPRCSKCKATVERARIYHATESEGYFWVRVTCHGASWGQEFNLSGMAATDALRFIRDNMPKELFGGPWKGYERYATTTKPERRKL